MIVFDDKLITLVIILCLMGLLIYLIINFCNKIETYKTQTFDYGATYCGKDTIYNDDLKKCIYYSDEKDSLTKLFNLIKDKIITVKSDDDTMIKVVDNNKVNIQSIKNEPKWLENWNNKGRFNGDKKLSGSNDLGYGLDCSCGDCAAWRGGNSGTCGGEDLGNRSVNNQRRVECNTDTDPNSCVCAYPYSPVGGICVTPYKYNPDNDSRTCCPSCVYSLTCIGEEQCKGVCEEQLVEYPGVRWVCDNLTALPKGENIRNISKSELDNNCKIDSDHHGENEYKCAYECNASQIECSKRCLPKLWKWDKLVVGGEVVGYTQSHSIIQFEPDTVQSDYCPIGDETCQNTQPPTISDLKNCEDCTDCFWELNDDKEYQYSCNNCKNCNKNNSIGLDSNGFRILEKIKCSNVSNCVECTNSFDTVTCNSCNSSSGPCIHEIPNNIQSTNTDNLKLYNKGEDYNPSNSGKELSGGPLAGPLPYVYVTTSPNNVPNYTQSYIISKKGRQLLNNSFKLTDKYDIVNNNEFDKFEILPNDIDLSSKGITDSSIYKKIVRRTDGKCLNSSKNGKGFFDCGYWDNPHLLLPVFENPNTYLIQNTDKTCLTKVDNTNVIFSECNANDQNQHWEISDVEQTSPNYNDLYIVNKGNNKRLTDSFTLEDTFTYSIFGEQNDRFNVKTNNVDIAWKGINNITGYKTITRKDGLCLNSSKDNKGFYDCGYWDNPHLFIPIKNKPDTYLIQNTDKKCLKEKGTDVIMTECNKNDISQQWEVTNCSIL
jgi:hypothetical protein